MMSKRSRRMKQIAQLVAEQKRESRGGEFSSVALPSEHAATVIGKLALPLGVEPKVTTEPTSGRRKELLLLASEEDTGTSPKQCLPEHHNWGSSKSIGIFIKGLEQRRIHNGFGAKVDRV